MKKNNNAVEITDNEMIELANKIANALGDDDKGRTSYCCRYQDGSIHEVKGWTEIDAMAACMLHKPGAPVGVSRGGC